MTKPCKDCYYADKKWETPYVQGKEHGLARGYYAVQTVIYRREPERGKVMKINIVVFVLVFPSFVKVFDTREGAENFIDVFGRKGVLFATTIIRSGAGKERDNE